MSGVSKIDELDLSVGVLGVKDKIVGLDVPMHDPLVVQKRHGPQNTRTNFQTCHEHKKNMFNKAVFFLFVCKLS